jgi:crotonobetainyl-CoA:carnitine CoA-transferase CaiB-like acyl-CoA transferase
LSALIHREKSGRGQHVQTSLYQGVLAYTTMLWQEHERASSSFTTMMAKTYPPGMHQTSLYECADREWIHAATMNGRTPTRTPEQILSLDPVDPAVIFRDPELRAAHEARLREAYRRRNCRELVEEFHQAGLGAEAVTPMSAVFSHPQFIANGMVATVEDPELGSTTQVGLPVVLAGTPGAIRGGQPTVGEHSREVLSEAGYSDNEIEHLVQSGVVEGSAPWDR